MDQLKQIESKREERLKKQEAIIKEYEEKKAAELKDTQKQIEEERCSVKIAKMKESLDQKMLEKQIELTQLTEKIMLLEADIEHMNKREQEKDNTISILKMELEDKL